jgi:MFS family permease
MSRGLRDQTLLNAYWIPINLQSTALMTIAIPAALARLSAHNHVAELALLASLVAAISMVLPPVAGAISDKLHRQGWQRRPIVLAGAAINAVGLVWLVYVDSDVMLGAAVLLATIGQNISVAAYSALIPEVVAPGDWGHASGFQGAASLVGSIAGLGLASVASPTLTFLGTAVAVVVGSLTVLAVPEGGRVDESEHVRVRNWYDFLVAFVSRFWTNYGLTLLMTFVLYFFRDVLKVENPSAGTAFFGILSLVGAVISAIWIGHISDRFVRKYIVALAGIPMALTAILIGALPDLRWLPVWAVLFGFGYGAFVSTGWALGIDSVPQLRNVARDLGIWGIAGGLPGIFAPVNGAWLLSHFSNPLTGYRALFISAGLAFALGSVVVLAVGARPRWPAWAPSFQRFCALISAPYYHLAYRIRGWGRLPWPRGATLVITNHQHDLDTTASLMQMQLAGPANITIYSAGSRRMFEPGFMGFRLKWLEWLLRRLDPTALFGALGVLPIENELRTRDLASFAKWGLRKHGDLPIADLFAAEALGELNDAASGKRLSWLFDADVFRFAHERRVRVKWLLEPFRSELIADVRSTIGPDLDRIESKFREGVTFYLTAEGRYTPHGRLNRFRESLDRLAPLADLIYVIGVSYDVYVGRRLSLLYNLRPPANPQDLRASVKAARPITASQMLCAWIVERSEAFDEADAVEAVRSRMPLLPDGAFVDPELRADPARMARAALAGIVRLGTVVADTGRYRLTERWTHPQFPLVRDMVAFQATFFRETMEALAELRKVTIVG